MLRIITPINTGKQPEVRNIIRMKCDPVPETASDEYFYKLPPFIANEAMREG
jgi:hypothetical protein